MVLALIPLIGKVLAMQVYVVNQVFSSLLVSKLAGILHIPGSNALSLINSVSFALMF